MNLRQKIKLRFVLIVALAVLVGLISYPQSVSRVTPVYNFFNKLKITLGLDLQGGIHLEYSADVSQVDKSKIKDALQGAQDVINRRINAFGVGEPLVQSATSSGDYRIIVELPGIKDVEAAKQQIKETPLLEFKEEAGDNPDIQKMFDSVNQQSQQKAQDVLNQIKNGANFEDMAKQNSEDPGSKDKGGDLGFVKKGTLVPEFDKVLFGSNMKPGEVYPDLVETQYGWHIIKFIESRGEGDNLEVHVEHILFAKKSASMYPDLKYASTGLTGKNLKSASVEFQSQGLSQPQVSLKFDGDGAKLFADLTKKNLEKQLPSI